MKYWVTKKDNSFKYDKEIIDFYRPYYTVYKTEKYWYNPIDNSTSLYGAASLRENLFLNKLPLGIIDWLEKHSNGDMGSYCIFLFKYFFEYYSIDKVKKRDKIYKKQTTVKGICLHRISQLIRYKQRVSDAA